MSIATVHQPVVDELARRGTPFHGVLYAGLMLAPDGDVRCSSSTPASAIPRRRSCSRGCARDLLALLLAATEPGGLAGVELEWDPRAAVCVVLASRGYPAGSSSGDAITRPRRRPGGRRGVPRGHAERDGEVVTAGGRVLGVTALGEDRDAARTAAYAAADMIDFDGSPARARTSPA